MRSGLWLSTIPQNDIFDVRILKYSILVNNGSQMCLPNCIIMEINDGFAEIRKLQPALETKIC